MNIPPIQSGVQFWEGRLLAKSTAYSDQVFVDTLTFSPIDEFYTEAQAVPPSSTAPAYTAQDDFLSGTYAGTMTGGSTDTAPVGGVLLAILDITARHIDHENIIDLGGLGCRRRSAKIDLGRSKPVSENRLPGERHQYLLGAGGKKECEA